jgi:undecaprenyl-phosphate 4-deoxy-4-formamido-L-arabinose transferase
MLSAGFGFCMALYFVVMHYYGVDAPTGWPSLIVTLLFIGGIQLLTIGIVGEYVGRVFIQQSKGPQFIVKNVTKSEKE